MKKKLSADERLNLLKILQNRFEKNINRHKGINWADVLKKLEGRPDKLWSLDQMEVTGGEPDVTGYDRKKDEFEFVDCAAESPKGRRSICYDGEAQRGRKLNAPGNNAIEMAEDIGISILNEDQYRSLQELGKFDSKTSSWIETPAAIRKLGGALFADFRYNHVFIYHNGADSYYAARGFRGMLKV